MRSRGLHRLRAIYIELEDTGRVAGRDYVMPPATIRISCDREQSDVTQRYILIVIPVPVGRGRKRPVGRGGFAAGRPASRYAPPLGHSKSVRLPTGFRQLAPHPDSSRRVAASVPTSVEHATRGNPAQARPFVSRSAVSRQRRHHPPLRQNCAGEGIEGTEKLCRILLQADSENSRSVRLQGPSPAARYPGPAT